MEHYKNLDLKDIVYFCEFDLIWKTEEWRYVVGYEGLYKVSDLGRVKSLKRLTYYVDGRIRRRDSRILKQILSVKRYLSVGLSQNNKAMPTHIHILVAIAFLNHTPCGCLVVVDHKDNNSLDNRMTNIHLVTHRFNNSKDKIKGSSNYTGVFYRKLYDHWRSCIKINGKAFEIGTFKDEIKASEAYQTALANLDKYDGDNKKFRYLIKSLL